MVGFNNIWKFRDERYRLIELNYAANDLNYSYFKDRSFFSVDSEIRKIAAEEFENKRSKISSEIDSIYTRRIVRAAYRWSIPLPKFPDTIVNELNDSDYWYFSESTMSFVLHENGQRQMRHEIALEVDMRFKPWLSWAAVIISFLALVVAVFKP